MQISLKSPYQTKDSALEQNRRHKLNLEDFVAQLNALIASYPDLSSSAQKDLSNVLNSDFLQKGISAGLATHEELLQKTISFATLENGKSYLVKANQDGTKTYWEFDSSLLAKKDLSNVTDADFKAKATSAGVGSGGTPTNTSQQTFLIPIICSSDAPHLSKIFFKPTGYKNGGSANEYRKQIFRGIKKIYFRGGFNSLWTNKPNSPKEDIYGWSTNVIFNVDIKYLKDIPANIAEQAWIFPFSPNTVTRSYFEIDSSLQNATRTITSDLYTSQSVGLVDSSITNLDFPNYDFVFSCIDNLPNVAFALNHDFRFAVMYDIATDDGHGNGSLAQKAIVFNIEQSRFEDENGAEIIGDDTTPIDSEIQNFQIEITQELKEYIENKVVF